VYDDVILVLKGLSLEVPKGQVVALLGSNGAGKSTTLKAISGLLRAEEGEVTDGAIELDGERIESLDPEQIVRRGIFQVMEGRRVFEDLTVDENLTMGGYTRRDFAGLKRDRELCFDYFPRLRERRRQIAGYLSGGEQQMLAISRALMTRPHPRSRSRAGDPRGPRAAAAAQAPGDGRARGGEFGVLPAHAAGARGAARTDPDHSQGRRPRSAGLGPALRWAGRRRPGPLGAGLCFAGADPRSAGRRR